MPFNYIQPKSLEECVKFGEEALLYAGGTDMIGLLKDGVVETDKIINLKNLEGLDKIEYKSSKGLEIGPLVKISDLIDNKTVQEKCPLL
ncbi:FAD binding domain-containing protein, partial [bacterium]|nr:FAD binding domain-containing protein [bacterium]